MTLPAAAILYDVEGLDPARERLTGLSVASRDFMRAYLDHGAPGPFHVHPTGAVSEAEIRTRFPTNRPVAIVPQGRQGDLAEIGTLFVPGPLLAPFSWGRYSHGDGSYALTGITHTMSTARALDAVRDLLAAPVREWDALICTSRAIKSLVEACLDAQAGYLADRFNPASPPPRPLLPVIPLGTTPDIPEGGERARRDFRAHHAIGDHDVAVLYLGRLAAHAKAHPIAMFRALGLAAARSRGPLVCILAGWFHDETARRAFLETARVLAPTVRVVTVDARDPAMKAAALAGADIFLSLVDSVQESFGLTPIEAMAAGLPCVVSDWDGYRDTVVDGETGFLVPTVLPPVGSGLDLARRRLAKIDSEAAFHALMTESTAVDPVAAAEALTRLAEDEDLRRRFGNAGKGRVRSEYAWSAIIPRYEELWSEQRAIREAALRQGRTSRPRTNPAAIDPFALFAGFATVSATPETRFEPITVEATVDLDAVTELPLATIDPRLVRYADSFLTQLRKKGTTRVDPNSDPVVWRAILWLLKAGFVRIVRR